MTVNEPFVAGPAVVVERAAFWVEGGGTDVVDAAASDCAGATVTGVAAVGGVEPVDATEGVVATLEAQPARTVSVTAPVKNRFQRVRPLLSDAGASVLLLSAIESAFRVEGQHRGRCDTQHGRPVSSDVPQRSLRTCRDSGGRRKSVRESQAVADAPCGMDQRRFDRINFLAQIADVRFEDTGVPDERVIPH